MSWRRKSVLMFTKLECNWIYMRGQVNYDCALFVFDNFDIFASVLFMFWSSQSKLSVAGSISRSHVDHGLEPGPGDSPDLGPGGGGGDVQAVQDWFLEVGDNRNVELSIENFCRCSPCGVNTRCLGCVWCVGFCQIKETTTTTAALKTTTPFTTTTSNLTTTTTSFKSTTTPSGLDKVDVSYSEPFIQMFEDIMAGLVNNDFRDKDLVKFFEITSAATEEDYIRCNKPGVIEIADFTKKVSIKLKEMISNNSTFKEIREYSFHKSRHTKNLFEDLPDELICKVERNSNIVSRRDLKPPYDSRLNHNVSTLLPTWSSSSFSFSSFWASSTTHSSPKSSTKTRKTTTTTATTTTTTTSQPSSSSSSSSSSSGKKKKEINKPKTNKQQEEQELQQTTATNTIATTKGNGESSIHIIWDKNPSFRKKTDR